MTTTRNLPQLAKQGDPNAIADLISQFLPEGIKARVSLKQDCLKVMLESAEAPDQTTSIECVRKVIENSSAESIRQVKVYGRELGEDFPSWQEEFAISPQSVPSVAELAKQGDVQAISTLVTQWVNDSRVMAKVSLKNSCLQIMLEAAEFPDQVTLVSCIHENLQGLKIDGCTQLKISGREPGDEFPDWQQKFDLPQPTETLTVAIPAEIEPFLSVAFVEASANEVPQPQPSRLELARTGDLQAITEVMNYLLRDKKLTVAVTLKNTCLMIMVQADQLPDQQQAVSYVRKVLSELKLNVAKQVKLYGRRKGSTFVAWTQELNLEAVQQEGSFWGSMFRAVTGAAEVVGGAAAFAGETVVVTVAGAAEAMNHAAVQTGGTIAETAVGVVGAVGSSAMQATDGVGYALNIVASSPQLQSLTKELKVDWLLAIVDRVDIVQAETHVKNLQRQYPSEKTGDIAHRIMMEKALFVGGSGFASSLVPGFAAALFAVDLAATMALQAEMVYQIASVYGLNLQESSRKGEVLAIFGMALGGNLALKAGLGFARNIPVAGAVIGASSNAAMIYALGYAACQFYEAKLSPSTSQNALLSSHIESEKYLQNALDQQVIMDQILVHLVLAGQPQKTLQQLLPELQALNLNPASLSLITANPRVLPSLDKLLGQLSQDFAVSLIAQCQKLAQADGVITPQEAKVIDLITIKLQASLASTK